MSTIIAVEVPDAFSRVLAEERGEATLPRWALEALVAEAVREGLITRGFGGELLGFGFHEREEFFASRGVTYDLSEEDLAEDREALNGLFSA